MNNITKIYLITNIDNDPNKVYVGKTTNDTRKNNHTRIYGKQITYDYIDSIDSIYRKDWKPLENKWIQHYIDLGYNVINKNKGGGGVESHTEETKQKMSKPKPESVKVKISNSLLGFKHPTHKKGNEHGNYGKIRTEEIKQRMSKPKPGISLSHTGRKKPEGFADTLSKSILQCDEQGYIIKEWKSLAEAYRCLGISVASICNNLKERTKNAGGFIWKYK